MSVLPCEQNKQLREEIVRFADQLKSSAHTLGDHGLDEREFYSSGLFRGAIPGRFPNQARQLARVCEQMADEVEKIRKDEVQDHG